MERVGQKAEDCSLTNTGLGQPCPISFLCKLIHVCLLAKVRQAPGIGGGTTFFQNLFPAPGEVEVLGILELALESIFFEEKAFTRSCQ